MAPVPKYKFKAQDIIDRGRVTKKNFENLKTWCTCQNLPVLSDEQLILFLLCTDDDVEAAGKTIISYFKCKQGAPDIFGGRDIDSEDFQKLLQVCEYTVIPTRTNNNEAVITWRLKDFSFYKFNVHSIVKMFMMVAELPLLEDPPDGLIMVADQKGFSLLHLTMLRYGPLKIFFHYLQESFPCKLKHVHVLNTVYFIDKLLKIIRPLMNDDLFNKITFHPSSLSMSEFFDLVPMKCLPKDYDGALPSISHLSEKTYSMFRNLKNFYKDEEDQFKFYKNS